MQKISSALFICSCISIIATNMNTVFAENATIQLEFKVNKLIGQWAPSFSQCIRPEFTFNATTATIQIDADGIPVSFYYPQVKYILNDNEIIADLRKRHPLGKTPSKTVLQFILKTNNSAELQMLKGKNFQLVRCPENPHPKPME